jgi:TrmH family RNA methyltransferase
MITLRKLQQLPPPTRLRKIVRLLDGFVQYRTRPESAYLEGLVEIARDVVNTIPEGRVENNRDPLEVPDPPAAADDEALLRYFDDLRYRLRSRQEIPVGDWDLLPPAGYGPREPDGPAHPVPQGAADTPAAESEQRPAGGVGIYLESIRSPFNAGSIIRTAAALGARRVCMSPDCPPIDHPRLVRTARHAEAAIELVRMPLEDLGAGWRPLIALELGGEAVETYRFPPAGTLMVGSEELGLSAEALESADARISVTMSGTKGSMNVAVACGIALHAWCVQAQLTDSGD